MSTRAMKQALEALECYEDSQGQPQYVLDAITSLRAAIEAAEKQEPVAIAGGEYPCNVIWYAPVMAGTKLYTRPQPAIPDGWQAVVSEFIAAWDGSADPKAVGSTCRFIRAESALRDLIAPKQEEIK